ncbi:hypothetical protein ABIF50_007379 [Bradyrhizobium diazoefficiens]|uniref:Uncharacterized protein n=1 Tax=Bradyrhizobium diazoefficiens TaxID=1355477 RepID=A0A0E4BJA4_9BRAD|nr:hypothetical protein NK6_326 [Bradyrhizobium diazoefficiens]
MIGPASSFQADVTAFVPERSWSDRLLDKKMKSICRGR